MKKLYVLLTSIMATLLMAAMVTNVSAQREVEVPTFNPNDPVFLNEVIAADTAADGSRTDSNTVYVLENDGYYPVKATIKHRFPLTIVAKDIDGVKPRVYPSVGTGGESSKLFEPRANITVKGLYLSHTDDAGKPVKNMFRVKGDEARVIMDKCHVDNDVQAPFRLDGENIKVYITNSMFSNLDNDWNNGRMIDTRGNSQDTIWIEFNTIYNVGSRPLRTDDEEWGYLYFNHNTIHSTGRRALDLSKVHTAVITNNIFHDCGILGKESSSTRAVINMDSIGDGSTQSITISHNNFFIDTNYWNELPDTITTVPIFDSITQFFVDASGLGATNLEIHLEFNKAPVPNYSQALKWWTNPDQAVVLPEFDTVNQAMFDFGYASGAVATGGTDGQQMGDPRWTATIPASVQENLDNGRSLNVYPMPLDGNATIYFSLNREALVEISVYNIVGQKVVSVENNTYTSGSHSINWNGEMLKTGVYILHMKTGNEVTTTKMLKR